MAETLAICGITDHIDDLYYPPVVILNVKDTNIFKSRTNDIPNINDIMSKKCLELAYLFIYLF